MQRVFPITKKWPAQDPSKIQLYSLPIPNGVKASIMLEEVGLPYEPHLVSIETNDVIDAQLAKHAWLAGDEYTIADIATLGWVNNLITWYEARELVDYERFRHVDAWLQRGLARPAVQRGLKIPSRA